MLVLYHAPISTCSQKVRLCLAEKGLQWQSEIIDFTRMDHLSEAYLRLNPNGVVPTLVHDDRPIIDSAVICEYLEETFPDQGQRLMPADSYGRASMRGWMRYIEEVPTTAIRYPSFNRLFTSFFKSMSEEAYEQHIGRLPLRKQFYRRFNRRGFEQSDIDHSLERLEQAVFRIDTATAERPFLIGDKLSIADICLLPTLVRMQDIGLSAIWADYSNAANWYARMCSRPSFQQAYYEGCRVSLDRAAL